MVEQGGRIVRVAEDGSKSTFLDIADEISAGGERGLLSVAFAPDFQRSGLLYVDYTDGDGNTRVVEYRSADGRAVEDGSRRELLRIDQPFSNHNGGLLLFGADGLLYIGTGDGGSAEDPQRNAQDLNSLLGKILRIDPRPNRGRPYGIPADNPFADRDNARAARSTPTGCATHGASPSIGAAAHSAIGDVGQNEIEEVDLVARGKGSGANFGWSAFEGDARFNADQRASNHTPPVLTYPTSGGNCSVTGGYVVRDPDAQIALRALPVRRLLPRRAAQLHGAARSARRRRPRARPAGREPLELRRGQRGPDLRHLAERPRLPARARQVGSLT